MFLVLVGTGLSVIADIFLKKSNLNDYRYLIIGALFYTATALPVAVVFKYMDFGKLFLIWEAVFVLLGIAVATWYYREPFTVYRLIALILALGALFFSYK